MRDLTKEAKARRLASDHSVVKVAAALVTAGSIVAGLYYGRNVLIPFAVAVLITFMLNPAVIWLVRQGIPKFVSAASVLTTVVIALAGLGVILGAQFRSIAIELPRYQTTISSKLVELQETIKTPGMLDGVLRTVERVQKQIEAKEQKPSEEPAPQRVEIIPRPKTPLESAASWALGSAEPLANAGVVLILVFLALLDIGDLRDRLIRLMGGDFHRSTNAMQDAGTRISQYLLMQFVVNVTYGLPLAAGLWMIGVPGALLWGALGAVMRFVPYVGPLVSAILPIALAFAVDDGWNMLLWTVALFVILELISNNIVEPMLYGASTGLSAISLISAAVVWTALWGPIGLMLSTPLTVCLLVLGRNIPQLHFLEIMLGSTPALDGPARMYQRLIADDVDEAIELANIEIEQSSVVEFYNATGIETLRLANREYIQSAGANHRLRFANGMDLLLQDVKAQHNAPSLSDMNSRVICIGAKSELDTMAGEMLAHSLSLNGVDAVSKPNAGIYANDITRLNLNGAEVVCINVLTQTATTSARHACRRLRRHYPEIRIVLALWNVRTEALTEAAVAKLEADAVVTSIREAVDRIQRIVDPEKAEIVQQAKVPDNDIERVSTLSSIEALVKDKREDFDALAKRATGVFNSGLAVISIIDTDSEYFVGRSGQLPKVVTDDTGLPLPMERADAICNHVVTNEKALVVPDIARDPRFADNKTIRSWNVRFYAGAPLRLADGSVIGALCILDPEPRQLEQNDIAVLEKMADDVVRLMRPAEVVIERLPSATVGQRVPD